MEFKEGRTWCYASLRCKMFNISMPLAICFESPRLTCVSLVPSGTFPACNSNLPLGWLRFEGATVEGGRGAFTFSERSANQLAPLCDRLSTLGFRLRLIAVVSPQTLRTNYQCIFDNIDNLCT